MVLCFGCLEDTYIPLSCSVNIAEDVHSGVCENGPSRLQTVLGQDQQRRAENWKTGGYGSNFSLFKPPCCQIQVERGDFFGTGIGWFHFSCFWSQGPQFKVSRCFSSINRQAIITLCRVWSNFEGVLQLRLEDQKALHLKVLGIPMPEHVCSEAAWIEAEESRKKTGRSSEAEI